MVSQKWLCEKVRAKEAVHVSKKKGLFFLDANIRSCAHVHFFDVRICIEYLESNQDTANSPRAGGFSFSAAVNFDPLVQLILLLSFIMCVLVYGCIYTCVTVFLTIDTRYACTRTHVWECSYGRLIHHVLTVG